MKLDSVTIRAATLSDAPQPLPAFVQFGRFQLVARLGKGGMGDVFLAVMPGVEGANKVLVVKRLHDSLLEDGNMRALFLAEGRLAARLNHPNVVQTYEVGEENGILYLSMEYLEGQPLSQLSKKLGDSRIDPIIAARIMSEALAGLHYAHELRDYGGKSFGLVHRDVSPQNVLVTYDGTTKVLDFGIAKIADQDQKTQTGVLKGKFAYMAPEQATGEVDRRSDVYSAGIVLWELLARRRLLAGATQAKTLAHVISGPPAPRLSSVLADIDPLLDDVVARALERDPEQRFQTAQAMRDALEAYIAKSGKFVRQEDLARLMLGFFDKRRERVADQVRSFMTAARESESLLELPAIKGSAIAGTATGVAATTATSSTQESSITEGTDSSIRTLGANEVGAQPTVRPGALFSREKTPASGASARKRLFVLAALAVSGLGLTAIALSHRDDVQAASAVVGKSHDIAPEPSAAVPVVSPSPALADAAIVPPRGDADESADGTAKRSSGKAKSQPRAPVALPGKALAASSNEKPAATAEPPKASAPALPGKRKYRTDF